MDYFKITIAICPFAEWLRDVLAAQLGEAGFESFVETETGLEAFIPACNFNEVDFETVLNAFREDFKFEIEKERIKSQNWNEVWEKNYFEPLVISNQCVVRAPFHTNYPRADYEIVIEPNMAFGTGNHETTSMMVEIILKNDMNDKTVLDMGCGTGILGILASMKGAKSITAIDIDEWSFTGASENAARNNIRNMDVHLGDANTLVNNKFDIIFANIHKNVLLNDLPTYANSLCSGGMLIMSGFYTEDIPEIKAKAEALGLTDSGFKTKNNWVAHSFTNP